MTNEAGLQFEGVPSDGALRCKEALILFKKLVSKVYHNAEEEGWDWTDFIGSYGGEI